MAWHDAAQRSVRSRAAAEVTSVDLLTRYPAATLPTVPRVPSSSTASISTTRPIRHPLKHEQAIVKLRRELIPLQQLEATKGRLLTMAETKKVGAIPDLIDEIEQLENDSRAWCVPLRLTCHKPLGTQSTPLRPHDLLSCFERRSSHHDHALLRRPSLLPLLCSGPQV